MPITTGTAREQAGRWAGLFAAGALVFTAWNVTLYRNSLTFYRRTNEIAEQGQVTDRYTKAIEQLGSTTVDVRIGGIYALERVARDSPRDHPTVMEVLAAFIREHSRDPLTRPAPVADTPEPVTRPDIQAAVTVIGRRDAAHDLRIDLRGVYLPYADLHERNFDGVDLTYADLTGAHLAGADLIGADLIDADLTGADLYGADLTGATLTGGYLTRAILSRADLTRADLTAAHAAVGDPNPKPANLTGANLTDAKFNGADLTGAILTGANLTGADLTLPDPTKSDPNPRPTDLTRADLTGANLTGVKFTPATLALANLTGAKWSEDVQPPGEWVYDHGQLRRDNRGADESGIQLRLSVIAAEQPPAPNDATLLVRTDSGHVEGVRHECSDAGEFRVGQKPAGTDLAATRDQTTAA